MRIVQYIILNQGLGMSTGKATAQGCHAAVNVLTDPFVRDAMWETWIGSGHTKIVLAARDTEHLLMVERYLNDRGVRTHLIIDEGRTEIPAHTPTALGCELVDKDDPAIQFSFGDLKTYRDPKSVAATPVAPRKWTWRDLFRGPDQRRTYHREV